MFGPLILPEQNRWKIQYSCKIWRPPQEPTPTSEIDLPPMVFSLLSEIWWRFSGLWEQPFQRGTKWCFGVEPTRLLVEEKLLTKAPRKSGNDSGQDICFSSEEPSSIWRIRIEGQKHLEQNECLWNIICTLKNALNVIFLAIGRKSYFLR